MELENEALRKQCAQLSSGTVVRPGRPHSETDRSVTAASTPRTPLPFSRVGGIGLSRNDSTSDLVRDVSHPELPENDHRNTSLYHGPTSTVYDDTSANHIEHNRLGGQSNQEATRHLLFSQTARQSESDPAKPSMPQSNNDDENQDS